ncbi:MAG: hypothetical protein ABSC23_12125 [Bryobacteraceae bacterium]|jgi:hypothetical protein
MKQDSYAEQVRRHAIRKYIEPSRGRHDPTVRIVAGDVHRALGLENRFPLVCNALSGRKFLETNHLTIERREGPPSGQGSRVAFTYKFIDERQPHPQLPGEPSLLSLRGIGKEIFQSFGGGEAFIRRGRERFYDAGEDL